jgi:PmbA protein
MTQERNLEEIAERVLRRALGHVDVAEVSVGESWDLSVKVRLGEVELIEEAGSSGLSLRVIKDGRVATTQTTDLTATGIERAVADALELADLSQPDPLAAPAPAELLFRGPEPELELFDPAVAKIDAALAISQAKAAEGAALASDPRLTLSEGARVSRSSSRSVLVLSTGFSGSSRSTYASLAVSPVVEDAGGKRRRGHYWTSGRHLAALEDPREVGQRAAERTLAKLGARSVKTCEANVVFDPDVSRAILASLAGCILGGGIWRRSSYLLDREQTRVASSQVTIIDDPLLPRAPGSRAFDGEGMESRRQVVVKEGILQTFLCDWYSARKLGRSSTGNAARSGGSIGAGTTNFVMQPGPITASELLAATDEGLYVTELMGYGFNAVTGDFSRGAAGFWITGGKLAFPVSEVTISSNLDAMLKGIDLVADDLNLRTAIAAPTFRVAQMTIAGE